MAGRGDVHVHVSSGRHHRGGGRGGCGCLVWIVVIITILTIIGALSP